MEQAGVRHLDLTGFAKRNVLASLGGIRQTEDRVGHPSLESVVVHELLEELRVILHQGQHGSLQGLVVLNSGILLVGVSLGVLVGGVLGNPGGNRFGDELSDPIGVLPRDITEVIVEGLEDVREQVQGRASTSNQERGKPVDEPGKESSS